MGIGKSILEWKAERKLEKAISNVDLDKAKEAIEMGARTVDYNKVHHSIYGTSARLETKDPVQMAEWEQWRANDRAELAQALSQPAPEIPDVSLWDAVVGENGLFGQKMSERKQSNLCKQLGQAIMDKDPDAITRALDAGATRVNMQQVHGIYGGMIKRVQDPVEFAEAMKLPEDTIDLIRQRTAPKVEAASGPVMR